MNRVARLLQSGHIRPIRPIDALQTFLADPVNPGAHIASRFESQPEITVWTESGWMSF